MLGLNLVQAVCKGYQQAEFNSFIVTVGSIPPNTSKCIELSFISDYNLHFHMSKHDILSQSMNV